MNLLKRMTLINTKVYLS